MASHTKARENHQATKDRIVTIIIAFELTLSAWVEQQMSRVQIPRRGNHSLPLPSHRHTQKKTKTGLR